MKNNSESDRRNFLKMSVSSGLALAVSGSLVGQAFGEDKVSMPGMMQPVGNETLWREGVIGPAQLSLEASQIAVDKATDKQAKEFAGFELTEAVAVTSVLKNLGTAVPEKSKMAESLLNQLKSTPSGTAFDQAYMKAQLENHEFLRDHTMAYLEDAGDSNMAEKQGHHLATLALAVFKEHVALCQRISSQLKA
jgi:putative membrane protein